MDLGPIIENWHEWLRCYRSYSSNTLESYMRDLKDFISFLSAHIGEEVNVGSLEKLSVPELRSWFSFRYARGINARSNTRALSVIRNFFKYIKNNYEVNNEAVFSLSRPIQRRTLPKALSISDIKTLVDFFLHNYSLQETHSSLSFQYATKKKESVLSTQLYKHCNFSLPGFQCSDTRKLIINKRTLSIKNWIPVLSIGTTEGNTKTSVKEIKLLDLGEPWIIKREIAIIVLLYGTGLRISEALNLKVSDISNESLIVTGKGDKQRQVFILPVVKMFIQEYVKACPYLSVNNEAQHLFVGVRGKKLGRTYVANRLQKIRRMLNLPEIVSPHAFRHSFATHLLQENVDIRFIQQLLGHSSIETTQVYTHLNYQDVFNMYKNFQQSLEKDKKLKL